MLVDEVRGTFCHMKRVNEQGFDGALHSHLWTAHVIRSFRFLVSRGSSPLSCPLIPSSWRRQSWNWKSFIHLHPIQGTDWTMPRDTSATVATTMKLNTLSVAGAQCPCLCGSEFGICYSRQVVSGSSTSINYSAIDVWTNIWTNIYLIICVSMIRWMNDATRISYWTANASWVCRVYWFRQKSQEFIQLINWRGCDESMKKETMFNNHKQSLLDKYNSITDMQHIFCSYLFIMEGSRIRWQIGQVLQQKHDHPCDAAQQFGCPISSKLGSKTLEKLEQK